MTGHGVTMLLSSIALAVLSILIGASATTPDDVIVSQFGGLMSIATAFGAFADMVNPTTAAPGGRRGDAR